MRMVGKGWEGGIEEEFAGGREGVVEGIEEVFADGGEGLVGGD